MSKGLLRRCGGNGERFKRNTYAALKLLHTVSFDPDFGTHLVAPVAPKTESAMIERVKKFMLKIEVLKRV